MKWAVLKPGVCATSFDTLIAFISTWQNGIAELRGPLNRSELHRCALIVRGSNPHVAGAYK